MTSDDPVDVDTAVADPVPRPARGVRRRAGHPGQVAARRQAAGRGHHGGQAAAAVAAGVGLQRRRRGGRRRWANGSTTPWRPSATPRRGRAACVRPSRTAGGGGRPRSRRRPAPPRPGHHLDRSTLTPSALAVVGDPDALAALQAGGSTTSRRGRLRLRARSRHLPSPPHVPPGPTPGRRHGRRHGPPPRSRRPPGDRR